MTSVPLDLWTWMYLTCQNSAPCSSGSFRGLCRETSRLRPTKDSLLRWQTNLLPHHFLHGSLQEVNGLKFVDRAIYGDIGHRRYRVRYEKIIAYNTIILLLLLIKIIIVTI